MHWIRNNIVHHSLSKVFDSVDRDILKLRHLRSELSEKQLIGSQIISVTEHSASNSVWWSVLWICYCPQGGATRVSSWSPLIHYLLNDLVLNVSDANLHLRWHSYLLLCNNSCSGNWFFCRKPLTLYRTPYCAVPYSFRSCTFSLLSVPFACTKMGKKTFAYSASLAWNVLQNDWKLKDCKLLNGSWGDLCLIPLVHAILVVMYSKIFHILVYFLYYLFVI